MDKIFPRGCTAGADEIHFAKCVFARAAAGLGVDYRIECVLPSDVLTRGYTEISAATLAMHVPAAEETPSVSHRSSVYQMNSPTKILPQAIILSRHNQRECRFG